MKPRECRSLAITLRAEEREVTVEMDGQIQKVNASEHLWELQELLATCQPEVIFLDLRLPITSGVRLLDVIRETHPGVPIATQVESKASGQHFFRIEAVDRGIVLRPFRGETHNLMAPIEDNASGPASFAAGVAEGS